MNIKELKTQFKDILKTGLINEIDPNQLSARHPDYPIVSNISLFPRDIELSDDQIDTLFEGQTIDITCDIEGNYERAKADKNLSSPNNWFKLSVSSLKLKIENEQLIMVDCNCFASIE